MKIINYSDKNYELYNWFPKSVQESAELVALPDINPGKAPLPTGSVARFDLNWHVLHDLYRYAESDVGCGMIMVRSSMKHADFDTKAWDALALEMKGQKGKLGDLGSGNHFLDALVDDETDALYFLCHTGSRDESKKISKLVQEQDFRAFNALYDTTREWAAQNRLAIVRMIEKHFGKTQTVVHNDHNHYEIAADHMIIRKGAVKVCPGEMTVIPSHMTGDAVVVQATENIDKTFRSLSHGTGRIMSRSEAKNVPLDFDREIRSKIYIPEMIKNDSLRTEAPMVYRDIDRVIGLLGDLVEVKQRLIPVAYIGQL